MRLIDADALIAEYDRVHKGPAGGARKLMVDAPTIDAVPVVRCKDCKHRKYLRGATADAYTCSLGWGLSGIVAEKDFCSYGERKDGEG